MEAAEAYKRLIDTKRYDIASLAVTYGKSEKHIYQMLKLCDLVKGIAELVRVGKLTASAGIVISKYDKKIQEEVLKDRLYEDGTGEWCYVTANVLEGKVQNYYTNILDNYHFDKTKCLACPYNSTNFDLFAEGNGYGKCANKKCLSDKQTAYLVKQAQAVALADPKLVFIGEQYSHDNEATQIIKKGGYEFKNVQTYNLTSYPTAPVAPQTENFKKTEDFDKAQERYSKEQQKYTNQTALLEKFKEQGKIRVYAKIGNGDVRMYYKEVATKDTKTNEQLIADLTSKKVRNNEIACEKTAEDIKELLRTDELPKSDFTPDEEQAMYFFMLDKLRRSHYKAVGLKGNDYYGSQTDEKKQKIVANLTEEQKTIIRRDYLYSHLTERTNTVSGVKGGLMLAFAKQHLSEKTAVIEATHKEEYGKKNARLDERIAGLKEAEKKVKADVKAKTAEQTTKAEKPAKTSEKTVVKAKKADAPTTPKAEVKVQAKDVPKAENTTPKTVTTKPTGKEEQPKATTQADKVLIVGVPKRQPKAEAVAV